MLNSWFASSSKDHDKPNDTFSLDPINTSATSGHDESLRIPLFTDFTSPHDAVLARMRGQPHVEPATDGLLGEEATLSRKAGQDPVPDTTYSTAEKEIVYDPFEGTPIGLLMTPSSDPMSQAETTNDAGPSSSRHTGDSGRKLEQWEHLSQVLDLQNELAKMHLEMEGVGLGDGKGKALGKGKARGKGKGDASWERSRDDLLKEWKPRRQTTTDTIGADGHDGDEEGVDAAGNEEIEMKKDREERFSNMADQFEGRKEAVQAIMNKLDHLSKALTQFHTLQAPDFEFSKADSKQNLTMPDMTPPKIRPKTAPYVSDTALSNIPDARPLHLPPIPSSRGALSSAPQAPLELETGSVLPAPLSRSKEDTVEEPMYANELESERQTHVMDSPDSMTMWRM